MTSERLFPWIIKAHLAAIAFLAIVHTVNWLFSPWESGILTLAGSVFDLESENSVPNFFSAMMLMAAGAVALLIAGINRADHAGQARPWVIIALCLFFMALDEGAMLHDRLAVAGQQALQTSGLFFIGWTLPYLVLLLILAGFALPIFLRLPRATLYRLIVAGAVYVIAALGLEMVEGLVLSLSAPPGASFNEALQNIVVNGERPLIWDILVFVEETGEMLAVALALRAMLLHLMGELGLIEIRLVRAASPRFAQPAASHAPAHIPAIAAKPLALDRTLDL